MSDCIDADGFRANVGIILCNEHGQLLLAGRSGQRGWQFPQGGIHPGECPEDAMYRELEEEVGLAAAQVDLLGTTQPWLRYRLPKRYWRRNSHPLCIGQKQIWYLLRLACEETSVCLDMTDHPEFDRWRWVDFWEPVSEVIYFKKRVYARALEQLGPLLFPDGVPPRPEPDEARPRRRRRNRSRRKARGAGRSGAPALAGEPSPTR
jgi:putative (di)nucleoside polyphosphate hydrolase